MLLKNASDSKPSIILDNALFDALSDVLSGVLIADNFNTIDCCAFKLWNTVILASYL
jgi:hypothetical protein